MRNQARKIDIEDVRGALHALFIAAPGTGLRIEDEKKCHELTSLLNELSRLPRQRLLVDAAAGKSALGLLAALLLRFEKVLILERDVGRIDACRRAIAALPPSCSVEVRHADVCDFSAWPEEPGVVVALHACGQASDAVIDASIAVKARRLLLVPCCYCGSLPHGPRAREIAAGLGLARHGALRNTLENALIDAERVLRLEAAGFEVEAVRFVPASVTPHNLLLRARLSQERGAMSAADARRRSLLGLEA
ncbi:MAG: methyltransferase [Myxococcota bacterium]|nr:methyltransferase [Myxococcota bacterium]